MDNLHFDKDKVWRSLANKVKVMNKATLDKDKVALSKDSDSRNSYLHCHSNFLSQFSLEETGAQLLPCFSVGFTGIHFRLQLISIRLLHICKIKNKIIAL